MGRIITCLILLALFLPPPVPGRRISCTSSESVHEGESAVISCDYHVNLRNNRRGFYIYKYPFGGKDPDVPAICDWDEDFIRCDVQPGYDVRVQGHKMVMNISSAQQTHAGRYVCHVLQPEDDIQSQECDLVVQKNENNEKVNCLAIEYPHREHLTTTMCIVPDGLDATSIVLERQEPSDTSVAEEIIHCNSKTNMCRKKDFKYQFTFKSFSSNGLRILIAVVEKPGRYTCKAEMKHMQTQLCDLQVDEGPKIVTVKEAFPQHLEPGQIALVTISVLGLVLVVVLFIFYERKRRKTRSTRATSEDTQPH